MISSEMGVELLVTDVHRRAVAEAGEQILFINASNK